MKQKWRLFNFFMFFLHTKNCRRKTHPIKQYYFVHLTDTFSAKNTQIYMSLAIWNGECIVCVVTRNIFCLHGVSLYQYKYMRVTQCDRRSNQFFYFTQETHQYGGIIHNHEYNTEHAFGVRLFNALVPTE